MRTLPDNPHLDHLRQQAKDLLAGLREAEPSTSLSEAQAALARQYGFRTWTELKAETDRLRGRAAVADDSVTQSIAARFGLGRISGTMRSLAPANETGRPWLLETDRGRWTVRQLERDVDVSAVETDVRLQEAAARAGVLLPAPVRSVHGAVVESIGDCSWRVHAWIEAGPPLSAPVSSAIAREGGAILARLHSLALAAPEGSGWWITHRHAESDWRELIDKARDARAVWAAPLDAALPVLLELRELAGAAEPPPAIVCHRGLAPANVRTTTAGKLAIVGWEHAGGLPPSWEIGSALLAWATGPGDEPMNEAAAQALIEGYVRGGGALPTLELGIFQATAAGWLHYLYFQAQAALAASERERRRHFERMVRHMLNHPPAVPELRRLLAATSRARVEVAAGTS